ncbi:glycoside hydrolase [Streptomyces sp. NPDC002659]|uniref:glycoside hydrolase n=1 Tax=Streptomyces sp. NPDC002659 TaxID=3364656 RepID=UPI0036C8343E
MTAAAVTATLLAGAASLMPGGAAAPPDNRARLDRGSVVVPVRGGQARVDPASLGVTARAADGTSLVISAKAAQDLGPAGDVSLRDSAATWNYPKRGLTVTARERDGRLLVEMRGSRDSELTWPVSGVDPQASAVQIPRGEGLSIPAADPWWNSDRAKLAGGGAIALTDGLTMPFWGWTMGRHGVSYVVPTDIGTTLEFASLAGRLRTATTHAFSEKEETRRYTVAFALTDSSPVAAAKDYRRWLAEHGQLGSLERKIEENPQAGRLIGAFHAYLWGDGRSKESVERMRALGLDRMWLGYDADARPMTREAVNAAKKAGYLVGPYDSWSNAQDPATADAPSSTWPAPVWPDACVREADGKVKTGFGGRGCYVSSQALAQAEPTHHYLADRTRSMTANGANSYFLDVDAAGELFRDHSPAHQATQARDRANRLARMEMLSRERKLVLGSESAGGWAGGVLAYSHGSSTPVSDHLWALERDRETWGGYAPQNAPDLFFRPAKLTSDAARAMYDPRYRVPLYETVLHDSVVSVERWELGYYKLPEQQRVRALLAMLYNTPLNFTLDGASLKKHGPEIAKLQRFFSHLQQAAGTKAMTAFTRLTADHRVQRTTFGDSALTVTANFGSSPYRGLPGGCVRAEVPGSPDRTLCP